jgi:hypothetical protein
MAMENPPKDEFPLKQSDFPAMICLTPIPEMSTNSFDLTGDRWICTNWTHPISVHSRYSLYPRNDAKMKMSQSYTPILAAGIIQ